MSESILSESATGEPVRSESILPESAASESGRSESDNCKESLREGLVESASISDKSLNKYVFMMLAAFAG